jgi:hypothetical protein
MEEKLYGINTISCMADVDSFVIMFNNTIPTFIKLVTYIYK